MPRPQLGHEDPARLPSSTISSSPRAGSSCASKASRAESARLIPLGAALTTERRSRSFMMPRPPQRRELPASPMKAKREDRHAKPAVVLGPRSEEEIGDDSQRRDDEGPKPRILPGNQSAGHADAEQEQKTAFDQILRERRSHRLMGGRRSRQPPWRRVGPNAEKIEDRAFVGSEGPQPRVERQTDEPPRVSPKNVESLPARREPRRLDRSRPRESPTSRAGVRSSRPRRRSPDGTEDSQSPPS
jgi:hypothetical protein